MDFQIWNSPDLGSSLAAAIAEPSFRGLYADNGSNNGPSVAADINCDDEEDCGNGGLEGSGTKT